MSLLLRLVVAALLSATLAAADDRTSFGEFDRDRDGRLGHWEVRDDDFLSQAFKDLDVDGDGYLSRHEMQASGGRNRPVAQRAEH